MANSASLSSLAGRALLGLFFLSAGFAKLGDLAGNMAFTASGGLPGWFVFPAIGLEIAAGLRADAALPDLAVAGGLLVLAGLGAGAWSFDARSARARALA